MRPIFFFFVFFLGLTPVWAAASPIAVLPYRIDYNGWLAVSVAVNGQGPYDFIVDTGASRSLIFEKLRDEQGMPLSGGPPQRVLGTGSEQRLPTYVVGDLAIGAARLDDVVTVALPDLDIDERTPDGILGLDFLEKFRVVFDRPAMQVRLYEAGTAPEPQERQWKTARLREEDFGLDAGVLYTVNGRVDRRRLDLLLDTGATGVLVNYPAFRGIYRKGIKLTIRPGIGGRLGTVSDALSSETKAQAFKIRRLTVGRVSWSGVRGVVFDAPIFKDLGRDEVAFGLFGSAVLVDRSFSLDFESKELRIGNKIR